MSPSTVAEMYELAGFELTRMEKRGSLKSTLQIGASAIPIQVINQIKAAPLRGQIPVTGTYPLREKILRCDTLIFNPGSVLLWHMPPNLDPTDFVAIAARRLVINLPNPGAKPAELLFVAPVTQSDLHGAQGPQGSTGWTSGSDDGRAGGEGAPGHTGQRGETFNFPAAFICYQEITLNIPLPSGPIGLRVIGHGIDGGNGGVGGRGGTGGAGARGTPGDRNCILGICTCSAGPGRGGDGGPGGPGGRGGDAGRGGNGVSVFIVGPSTELPKLDRTEMTLTQGRTGLPGSPGPSGTGGQEGGGGSKPFECAQGGGSGRRGADSTTNLGPGAENSEGMEGAVFTSNRNNTDLF